MQKLFEDLALQMIEHYLGDLLREVGLMRSQLEYAVDPTPDEVDGLIELVQQSTARASDVVAKAFFRPVGTIVWSN